MTWAGAQHPEAGANGAGSARDRGAATLLLLAIGLVFVAAGVAGAAVGAARVGRHRAQVAADLGALAGAARAIEGPEAACARAARIILANGGRMTSCGLEGLEIVVHAEVTAEPLPGLARRASAAARAGPVQEAVGPGEETAGPGEKVAGAWREGPGPVREVSGAPAGRSGPWTGP